MKMYELDYGRCNAEWHGLLKDTPFAGFSFAIGWYAAKQSILDAVEDKLGIEQRNRLYALLDEYEKELGGKIESPVLPDEDGKKAGEIAEYRTCAGTAGTC